MTNESTTAPSREDLIKEISSMRKEVSAAQKRLDSGSFKNVNGYLYKYPTFKAAPEDKGKRASTDSSSSDLDKSVSDEELVKGKPTHSPESARRRLQELFDQAKRLKQERITPRFDTAYSISAYTVYDEVVTSSPGAYGAWVHWDPQLWLEYEQFVEIVTPMALFSLSMPSESTGTYAWVLPVEKREDDDANVSARLPKASIPPVTWILSLLLQSSTLPYDQRSTFYVETDRLSNVLGLRQRYIRAAIKDPTAVEQYGTY